jgi:hypothetical protein
MGIVYKYNDALPLNLWSLWLQWRAVKTAVVQLWVEPVHAHVIKTWSAAM